MQNQRDLKDAELTKSTTLPNADTAATNTAGIDLGNTAPGSAIQQQCELVVKTTAGTGVDTKTIAVSLEDSADNVTFAAITGLGTRTITSVGTVYPASEFRWAPPAHIRRYVRAHAVGVTGGGNATDATMELSARF